MGNMNFDCQTWDFLQSESFTQVVQVFLTHFPLWLVVFISPKQKMKLNPSQWVLVNVPQSPSELQEFLWGKYILLNIDVCSTCYCTYFFQRSILTLLFDQNSIQCDYAWNNNISGKDLSYFKYSWETISQRWISIRFECLFLCYSFKWSWSILHEL